eukprot:TRINITY_DN10299_c0_g1_i1.p1 TRINITY_DN10299_c0_g1~~TRINITY_DN10299_c0_g1_i1.p1  ORF type:complete len:456 (+),score=60.10 TRINITY_DN10299_c0_g1_i1:64-1431(+)
MAGTDPLTPLPAPLPGSKSSCGQAVDELRAAVARDARDDPFADTNSLPWTSEATLPHVRPVLLFRTLLADGSSFDTEWHRQNGDEDIVVEKWRHPQQENWGGQRAASMTISAGQLGKQKYREDHRYVFVTSDDTETLFWHRSGRLANPPMMVPKFRVECAYFFVWSGGKLVLRTRSGLGGYNGWLRGRIEGDCKKDFHASQPKFERFLRSTLEKASETGAPSSFGELAEETHEQLLHSAKQTRMAGRLGGASTVFASCHSLDLEALIGEVVVVRNTVDAMESMGTAELAEFAIGRGAVQQETVTAFRSRLLAGIKAGPAPEGRTLPEPAQKSGDIDVRNDSCVLTEGGGTVVEVRTATSDEGSDAPPADLVIQSFAATRPPDADLDKMHLGMLVDVAERLYVCGPMMSEFRAELLKRLQQPQQPAAAAPAPSSAEPFASQQSHKPKGACSCCVVS